VGEIEAVLDERRTGKGVVTNTVATHPWIEKKKRKQKKKQKKELASARV
jgi:hypothetical protein